MVNSFVATLNLAVVLWFYVGTSQWCPLYIEPSSLGKNRSPQRISVFQKPLGLVWFACKIGILMSPFSEALWNISWHAILFVPGGRSHPKGRFFTTSNKKWLNNSMNFGFWWNFDSHSFYKRISVWYTTCSFIFTRRDRVLIKNQRKNPCHLNWFKAGGLVT